jgi:hypothetical protein
MFLDCFTDEIAWMGFEWSLWSVFPKCLDAIAIFCIMLGDERSMSFFIVILDELLKPECL